MPVSADDVICAFRMLLGREPKDSHTLEAHMSAPSRESLRAAIMNSAEFRQQVAALQSGTTVVDDIDLGMEAGAIDYEATCAELCACFLRVHRSWSDLGSARPYFSVLTSPLYSPNEFPHHAESFWSSGDREADRLVGLLKRHRMTDLDNKVCVEVGCGVGRVTIPLARAFGHILAYDVSAPHLSIAAQRAAKHGIENIKLVYSPNPSDTEIAQCDVYYSRLVLQHNPPPVIAWMLRNAMLKLRSGGLAVFQVVTFGIGYSFRLSEWLQSVPTEGMEMHCLPQAVIFEIVAASGCRVLDVRSDYAAGLNGKYISKTFVVKKSESTSATAAGGVTNG